MSKATKGPWTTGKPPHEYNYVYGVDSVDGKPQLVAKVYGYGHEEVVANVRRIAAADDLLEACKAHQEAENHQAGCEECEYEVLCETGEALYSRAVELRIVAIAKAEPRIVPTKVGEVDHGG